ncbi:MAG TPA: hypothetical protein VF054_04120 [Micromonosporaceae bacterium]
MKVLRPALWVGLFVSLCAMGAFGEWTPRREDLDEDGYLSILAGDGESDPRPGAAP